MSRWAPVLVLRWTAAAEDARRAQRAEVARVDAIKGALAEPCWAGGCASLDEALEADAPARLAAPPLMPKEGPRSIEVFIHSFVPV